MRKYVLCPLAALALGCGGAALRMWELAYHPGATPVFSLGLCGAILVLLGILSLSFRTCRSGAFFTRDAVLSPILLILSAVLLAGSAMFRLAHAAALAGIGPDSTVSPLRILTAAPLEFLLGICAIPGVVALAFLAKEARSGTGKAMGSAAVVFPALFCWVWLIDFYRSNTSDPVVSDYILLMAAVIFFLLTAQGRAGFSFSDGSTRLTLFSGLCSVAVFPLVLTHEPGPVFVLTAAAFFCYALCTVIGLLRDLPIPQPVPKTETEPETETETEESSDE